MTRQEQERSGRADVLEALAEALEAQAQALRRLAELERAPTVQPEEPAEWVPFNYAVKQLRIPREWLRKKFAAGEIAARLVGREKFVRVSSLNEAIADAPLPRSLQPLPTSEDDDEVRRLLDAGRLRVIRSRKDG